MPSNFDRANWAHKAIQAFADEAMSSIVDEESLTDLICDLGHFGRMKLGLSRDDLVRIYETAIGAWSAEDASDDGDPRDNDLVHIGIKGLRSVS